MRTWLESSYAVNKLLVLKRDARAFITGNISETEFPGCPSLLAANVAHPFSNADWQLLEAGTFSSTLRRCHQIQSLHFSTVLHFASISVKDSLLTNWGGNQAAFFDWYKRCTSMSFETLSRSWVHSSCPIGSVTNLSNAATVASSSRGMRFLLWRSSLNTSSWMLQRIVWFNSSGSQIRHIVLANYFKLMPQSELSMILENSKVSIGRWFCWER